MAGIWGIPEGFDSCTVTNMVVCEQKVSIRDVSKYIEVASRNSVRDLEKSTAPRDSLQGGDESGHWIPQCDDYDDEQVWDANGWTGGEDWPPEGYGDSSVQDVS